MEGAPDLKTLTDHIINGRRTLGRRGQVCSVETYSCNGATLQPKCSRCNKELDNQGVRQDNGSPCKESPRRSLRGLRSCVLPDISKGTPVVLNPKTCKLPTHDGHKSPPVNDVPLGQTTTTLPDSNKRTEQNHKKPVASPENKKVRGKVDLTTPDKQQNQDDCSQCKHTCCGIAYKWTRNRIYRTDKRRRTKWLFR